MKLFYAGLCLLGIALPYGAFIPWVLENGFSPGIVLQEILASRLSVFAWMDVLVSAVVLIGFIIYQGAKDSVPILWAPILGTCAVGVSFGLPLFLFFREIALDKLSSNTGEY